MEIQYNSDQIKIAIYNNSLVREEIIADFSKKFIGNYNSNISHAGNYLAIAGSADYQVGIDIEQMTKIDNFLNVAKDFFHPLEYLILRIIPKKLDHKKREIFTKAWVIKEAWCKLNKIGINEGMPAINLGIYFLSWIFLAPQKEYFKIKHMDKFHSIFLQKIILEKEIFYLSVVS